MKHKRPGAKNCMLQGSGWMSSSRKQARLPSEATEHWKQTYSIMRFRKPNNASTISKRRKPKPKEKPRGLTVLSVLPLATFGRNISKNSSLDGPESQFHDSILQKRINSSTWRNISTVRLSVKRKQSLPCPMRFVSVVLGCQIQTHPLPPSFSAVAQERVKLYWLRNVSSSIYKRNFTNFQSLVCSLMTKTPLSDSI